MFFIRNAHQFVSQCLEPQTRRVTQIMRAHNSHVSPSGAATRPATEPRPAGAREIQKLITIKRELSHQKCLRKYALSSEIAKLPINNARPVNSINDANINSCWLTAQIKMAPRHGIFASARCLRNYAYVGDFSQFRHTLRIQLKDRSVSAGNRVDIISAGIITEFYSIEPPLGSPRRPMYQARATTQLFSFYD